MKKSDLYFGPIYYSTLEFWVLFNLQLDFFFQKIVTQLLFGCISINYSTSKIRPDLTWLDEFLSPYSDCLLLVTGAGIRQVQRLQWAD